MASLSSRVAAALVERYPAVWRERYGAEMLALLEERGVRCRDLLDLLRACCSEWRIDLANPETHPLAAGLILTGSPMAIATALALTFDAIARSLVPVLDRLVSVPNPAIRSWLVIVVPLLLAGRMFLITYPQVWWSTQPTLRVFMRLEAAAWMVLLFGGVLSLAWNGASRFATVMLTFTFATPLLSFSGNRWPRVQAYQMVKTARRELVRAEHDLVQEESRPPELTNDRAVRRARANVERLHDQIRSASHTMRGTDA